jgi:hypothetical protein
MPWSTLWVSLEVRQQTSRQMRATPTEFLIARSKSTVRPRARRNANAALTRQPCVQLMTPQRAHSNSVSLEKYSVLLGRQRWP